MPEHHMRKDAARADFRMKRKDARADSRMMRKDAARADVRAKKSPWWYRRRHITIHIHGKRKDARADSRMTRKDARADFRMKRK